jgi:DHA1 family tetracycline resistance protein-like MFS transporter
VTEPLGGAAAPQRARVSLAVLFGVVIVDLVGFGIVMPILPFYADEHGASATELGAIFTAYAAAQFVCAPLWGRLSDRIGRRPVMLGTIAGTAFSLLLLGLAPSLLWIFAARCLAGAFAANIGVASAYIADVTPDEERTRWMGMLGASFGVGFVLGPAIGGILAPFGHAVPMLAAAGLATVNLGFAAFSLREPPRHAASAGAIPSTRAALLRDPLVRRLCLVNLAFSIGVTQLETMFAFFMKDRFGYGVRDVAFFLAGMAVLMGAIQGGGMRALSARFPERTLIIGGALLLAAGFAGLPQAGSAGPLVAALVAAAVGRAVFQPSLMSMTSVAAAVGARGAVMGTFQASAAIARVAGPLAAGWLYDWDLAGPFWLAAGLCLVVAWTARGLPARVASAGSGAAGLEAET